MANMIWLGAAVSVVGLAGLIWCIVIAASAKRNSLDDDEMRTRLQKVVVLNMIALLLSLIGLAMVVVGIMLS